MWRSVDLGIWWHTGSLGLTESLEEGEKEREREKEKVRSGIRGVLVPLFSRVCACDCKCKRLYSHYCLRDLLSALASACRPNLFAPLRWAGADNVRGAKCPPDSSWSYNKLLSFLAASNFFLHIHSYVGSNAHEFTLILLSDTTRTHTHTHLLSRSPCATLRHALVTRQDSCCCVSLSLSIFFLLSACISTWPS